jgi:hypothetical protein
MRTKCHAWQDQPVPGPAWQDQPVLEAFSRLRRAKHIFLISLDALSLPCLAKEPVCGQSGHAWQDQPVLGPFHDFTILNQRFRTGQAPRLNPKIQTISIIVNARFTMIRDSHSVRFRYSGHLDSDPCSRGSSDFTFHTWAYL